MISQKKNIVASNNNLSYQSTPGMAGWQPYIGVPNNNLNQLPYSTSNTQYWSTATDADEHIIVLFNEATNYFNSVFCSSDGVINNSNGNYTYSNMLTSTISDILTQSINTFLTSNISNFPTSNYDTAHLGFYYPLVWTNGTWIPSNASIVYNSVLTNDNFGGGTTIPYNGNVAGTTALNPSYFDPNILEYIYKLSTTTYSNNTFTYYNYNNNSTITYNNQQIITNYVNATKNSINYLLALQLTYKDPNTQNLNSYGLPDNPYWNEGEYVPGQESSGPIGPHFVGYDSIRFLSNVGKFVYMWNKNPSGYNLFTQSDYDNIITLGIRQMNYLIYNCINVFETNMALLYSDGSALNGGALLGPLSTAMTALLPYVSSTDTSSSFYSPITTNNVYQIQNSLNSLTIDISTLTYDNSNPSKGWTNWQNDYYSTSLVLTNKYYQTQMISNQQIII